MQSKQATKRLYWYNMIKKQKERIQSMQALPATENQYRRQVQNELLIVYQRQAIKHMKDTTLPPCYE